MLDSNQTEATVITKMKSILYSLEMVQLAAVDLSKLAPYNSDPRVKRIKIFSTTWASEFLKRAKTKKHRIHAKDRTKIRPSPVEVQKTMRDIQTTILLSGLPKENIFSVDETAVHLEAQFLHKYVKNGTNEKATDDADEKKRITDMAALSIAGKSLPPYLIIQCSSTKADLSKTTVLDTLLLSLNQNDPDRWEKYMWEKTLQLPNKKTKLLEDVTFKRPYLICSQSRCVVTCQSKAWMDRVGLLLWCDTIIGPWTEATQQKKSIIIWDNCASHLGDLIKDYFGACGITLCFLPKNMTDLLQILDLIFNGPLKAYLRYRRFRPIYDAFQAHILACASATAKHQPTPPWILPKVNLPVCIQLLIDFGNDKNSCMKFEESVQKCFIKAGQWFISEDDLSFVQYDLAKLTLGSEAVDKVLMFGNDDDACVQYTCDGDATTLVPDELVHPVHFEQEDDDDVMVTMVFFPCMKLKH